MIISVLNESALSDADVQIALRAINRQISQDFETYWDLSGHLRLERRGSGRSFSAMRGDAIIFLRDKVADSFHIATPLTGIPFGLVFVNQHLIASTSVPWLDWSVALSHEALELIADPQLNMLVQGPHPAARRKVFHYREICDPVQQQFYVLDGVNVANFVLPHYYNSQGEELGRNDFLGTDLRAFRWNEGGTIGFWDPWLGRAGEYVVYPQYKPTHLSHKLRRLKGKWGRLERYRRSHPHGK